MADPAGILLHLKLIDAVHEIIEALSEPGKVPGATLGEQERDIKRRTEKLGRAYNASLRWAKAAGRAIEASEVRRGG
jgi:hypothetical protein